MDNAVREHVSSDRPESNFVCLNCGISWGKYSEGARSRERCAYASGCQASREKAEVIVALQITLLFANSDTIGSPDLSWTFKRSKSIQNVGVKRRGGTGALF